MIYAIDENAQAKAPGPGGWRLEHSYAALPAVLHVAVGPTAVRAPRVVAWNRTLAEELGLHAFCCTKLGSSIFERFLR